MLEQVEVEVGWTLFKNCIFEVRDVSDVECLIAGGHNVQEDPIPLYRIHKDSYRIMTKEEIRMAQILDFKGANED